MGFHCIYSNWSYSPETLNLGPNWLFFVPRNLDIWWMTLKTIGHLFYTTLSFVHNLKAIGIFKLELQSGNAQFGSKLVFFVPGNLENWQRTLKDNRAPLLYHVKLCASFQIHWWSQTWVTVRKRSIQVKIGAFLSHVTLKIDRWPWKTIGHLSYAASSFVHHFITILVNQNWSYSPEMPNLGKNLRFFLAMWPWNLLDGVEKQ